MPNIKPIIKLITKNSGKLATSFVQRPQFTRITPESLKTLRPTLDEVCLSSQKKVISLDEVKALFPTGKLDENNYLFREMNTLWHDVQTPRQKIRLEPELSEKDFKIIQDFMNKENGRYIERWKGFSDTDTVPNIQKLALFTRTMRLTKQTNEFLEFNPFQWDIAYEGIVRKPKELILPVFRYKINSNLIHEPLSKKTITKEVKENIDGITKFLNMFTVKKDFIGYRGDQSFGILSGIKYEGQNFSLANLMEDYTGAFQDMYRKNIYNQKAVDKFGQKYIIGQDVVQPRFMSIGIVCVKQFVDRKLQIVL